MSLQAVLNLPKATNPKFDAVIRKMVDMHNKKSADYANDANRYSNFEHAATSAGTTVDVVFRVLIGVKLARLAELQGKGKAPQNESIMDSLIDLAVYSTLYASYYETVAEPVAYTSPLSDEQIQKIVQQIDSPVKTGYLPTNWSKP